MNRCSSVITFFFFFCFYPSSPVSHVAATLFCLHEVEWGAPPRYRQRLQQPSTQEAPHSIQRAHPACTFSSHINYATHLRCSQLGPRHLFCLRLPSAEILPSFRG